MAHHPAMVRHSPQTSMRRRLRHRRRRNCHLRTLLLVCQETRIPTRALPQVASYRLKNMSPHSSTERQLQTNSFPPFNPSQIDSHSLNSSVPIPPPAKERIVSPLLIPSRQHSPTVSSDSSVSLEPSTQTMPPHSPKAKASRSRPDSDPRAILGRRAAQLREEFLSFLRPRPVDASASSGSAHPPNDPNRTGDVTPPPRERRYERRFNSPSGTSSSS